jgi:hypothetical protein
MVAQPTRRLRREPGWIARDERTNVLMPGTARRADGSMFDVIVHDISRGGCRLECEQACFEIGEWLEIEVAGLEPFPGQVRWALLGSAGVRFPD